MAAFLILYTFPFFVSSTFQSANISNISCNGIDAVGNGPDVINHLTNESPNPTTFIVLAFVFGALLLFICGVSFDCCKNICGCIYEPFWNCLKAYSADGEEEALGTKRLVALIYFLLTGAIGIGLWQAYRQTGVTQGTWVERDMMLCWKGVNPYCGNCGAPYRPEIVVRYYDSHDKLLTLRTCPELPCHVLRENDEAIKDLETYQTGTVYTGSVTKQDESVGYLVVQSASLVKVLGIIFFIMFALIGVGFAFSYLCGCMSPRRDTAASAFS